MALGINELWTAAGVLLGFQVTSFLWRIAQESDVADRGDICWIPPADVVNLVGMVVLVVGVFIAPIIGFGIDRLPAQIFGLAALLFVGHCFALAGHYELFNIRTSRSFTYFPLQERLVIVALGVVIAIYVWALVPSWSAPPPTPHADKPSAIGSTELQRYTWAFAQATDGTVGPSEECRRSLADVVYSPNNASRLSALVPPGLFVFSGLTETYRIVAFTSEGPCNTALASVRANQPRRPE